MVGENLQSCTSEINIYKLTFLGISDNDIVFVDTPGFDDTNLSDAEILKKISDWLKRTWVFYPVIRSLHAHSFKDTIRTSF